MKRFVLFLFTLLLTAASAFAAKNTVLVHPGETVYARFDIDGKKIRLANAGTDKDENAQVVFIFDKEPTGYMRRLKIENRFDRDFVYKVEMRSLSQGHQQRVPSTPVVASKVAFEDYPAGVEELALYDFKIER
jgi:hypothetical protein